MIDRNAPLRLKVAAELAFPGHAMSPSGLRREARRGNLVIEKIAGKEFTTLAEIEAMRFRCRTKVREPGSGSAPALPPAPPLGSSETVDCNVARDAALLIVTEQSSSSPNTSRKSTPRRQTADTRQTYLSQTSLLPTSSRAGGRSRARKPSTDECVSSSDTSEPSRLLN